MSRIFQGLKGELCMMDEILVKEHDERLLKVLKKIKRIGDDPK